MCKFPLSSHRQSYLSYPFQYGATTKQDVHCTLSFSGLGIFRGPELGRLEKVHGSSEKKNRKCCASVAVRRWRFRQDKYSVLGSERWLNCHLIVELEIACGISIFLGNLAYRYGVMKVCRISVENHVHLLCLLLKIEWINSPTVGFLEKKRSIKTRKFKTLQGFLNHGFDLKEYENGIWCVYHMKETSK